MDARLVRRRGSASRAALVLSISGLLLVGCSGTLPGTVGGASRPVTTADASGQEIGQGPWSPSLARARGIPSPLGPGGRLGIWPGRERPVAPL
ncbi:hypothetical protein JYK14_08355 [Siccirubricoccus sp. KC 17139]|uniref:Uncharacterized protein n=1 Tax=Siccirubricoccus soli TaxID=2899147 RepID=A0ABT1D2N3_9PROT|nr:hypothetical protein [Siccirubricoccus soli]MCO6416178.1 hypothetical protein [Siccirubricoccus soli]MCP2682312.1 hypothetical protein [Siccirubricoccus soli]